MPVLTLAVRTHVFDRDRKCPICRRPRVRQFLIVFHKPTGINGAYTSADVAALCRRCIDAIKRREVGIAGNADEGLKITDARPSLFP